MNRTVNYPAVQANCQAAGVLSPRTILPLIPPTIQETLVPRRARPPTVHPIALRELEVKRVADITPGLRRVTLTGDELDALTTPEDVDQLEFTSTGFDDDIKLIFAYPGETEPVLPLHKDGGIEFPKERRPLSKSYTVRR